MDMHLFSTPSESVSQPDVPPFPLSELSNGQLPNQNVHSEAAGIRPQDEIPTPNPTLLPAYRPQFSTATSFSIHRLRSSHGGRDSSGRPDSLSTGPADQLGGSRAEDRSPLEAAQTLLSFQDVSAQITKASLSLEMPSSTLSALLSSRDVLDMHEKTLKRKRTAMEPVDFTKNTMALPSTITGHGDSTLFTATTPTSIATPAPTTSATETMIHVKNDPAKTEPLVPVKDAPAFSPDSRNSRNATVRRCTICQRGMSLTEDSIVTCRKCNTSSHRDCAPSVKSGTRGTGDPTGDHNGFLCESCLNAENKLQVRPSQGGILRPSSSNQDLEQARKQYLATLSPNIQLPPKTQTIGFEGGQASDFARTEYFYSKTKPELLNLLSFCDQLEPQLLIDILVSVSKKHPHLPIFDSPDWAKHLPSRVNDDQQRSHPSSAAAPSSASLPPHHQNSIHALPPKPRHRHKSLKKYFKQALSTHISTIGRRDEDGKADAADLEKDRRRRGGGVEEDEPEDEVEAEAEQNEKYEQVEGNSTVPPTWPKAGEGLYAKLVAEVEDREFLVDDNDEEAFSHFMVDRMGRQIVGEVALSG